MSIKPFGDQTLQTAIDRARACELTARESKAKPMNHAAMMQTGTAELVQIVATLATRVEELTRTVENPTTRFRASRNDETRPRDNNAPNRIQNRNNAFVCFNCGQPGHISRRCPNRGMDNPPPARNAQVDQNVLQNLLQQATTQNPTVAINRPLN